jgi:hypothetical protein
MMTSSNVLSLAVFRAKRGLPEVSPDTRSPLEKILACYLPPMKHMTKDAALRMLASGCATSIVRWAEANGAAVDDAARFQFYAAGSAARLVLQIRVSRVGQPKGPWQAMEFHLDASSKELVPEAYVQGVAEVFKPLLTLPMSGFYRLR